jgi:hypothetical protein
MDSEDRQSRNDGTENPDKVKRFLPGNRAAALSVAVMLALSTALAGCSWQKDEEDDDTYYSGGGHYMGSYYYSSGSSYKNGSWGKSYSMSGKSGYSSARGGSVGG